MIEPHLDHQRILAATLPSRRPLLFGRPAASLAAWILLVSVAVAGCRATVRRPAAVPAARAMVHSIVPAPASHTLNEGQPFRLDSASSIIVDNDAGVARTGEMLAALLRPSTGYAIPVLAESAKAGAIALRLSPAASGEEYQLSVTRDSVRIAGTSSGIFRG
ncbi:MAG: hypothetical protein M3373_13740, partial [Gemmatimonadota bacterium]|nr:hypothetical protein [Gemmatimonadota bacterium]